MAAQDDGTDNVDSECADDESRTEIVFLQSVPPMSSSESSLMQIVHVEASEASDVTLDGVASVSRCGDEITVRLLRGDKVVAHTFIKGHMTVGALTPSKRAEYVAQGRVVYDTMAESGQTLYVLCAPYTFQDMDSLMFGLSESEFIHIHFSLWREGVEAF
jgi:hypothetical protein